jgi:integrase/recombinase XerD
MIDVPKLPKNVVRKGKAYYFRRQVKGKEIWVPLGSNRDRAVTKAKELRDSRTPLKSETFAAVAARWCKLYVAIRRTPENQKKAHQRLRDYVDPVLGPIPISRVKAGDLRRLRLQLDESGLSPQTVKHILSDVRCLFHWAVDEGYLDKTPFPRGLMPRIQERPPNRLTEEEVAELVQLPEPYGFIIRFAVGTGLRWGELTRAESSHVHNGVLLVPETKNLKLRRVPLHAELRDELRMRVGRFLPNISRDAFTRRVRKHSSVKRFTVHRMRHTFTTRCAEVGCGLLALKAMTGHSKLETLLRYARPDETHAIEEMKRIGGKLGKMTGRSVEEVSIR